MTFGIGRLWGIPIELHYSWFPVFGLLAYSLAGELFTVEGDTALWHWPAAVATTLLFFLCLLAHELAHCVVARRVGIRVLRIRFFVFGGVAQMATEPVKASHELKMAAAGPLMSLALAVLAFGATYGLLFAGWYDAANVAIYLAVANLALCVFNLLPAFPMDGGRMLRAVLWRLWQDVERATAVASRLSRGFGLLMIVAGLYLGIQYEAWNAFILVLMGAFLIQAAEISYNQVRLRQSLEGQSVGGLMAAVPTSLPADLSVADALTRWDAEPGMSLAPVQKEGRLAGLLDMEEAAALASAEKPVVPISRLMRAPSRADLVHAESPAWNALRKMVATGRHQLYVVRKGTLLGVLHLDTLLAAVLGNPTTTADGSPETT